MATALRTRDQAPPAALSRYAYLALAVAALLLFFYLALDSLVDDSPTIDEQNHIARGLAFLRTGDPRFSLEHPPLINTLSALPLLTMPNLRLPTDHPSWEQREGWYAFADLFLWDYNRAEVERIVFLARLPIVFLAMALALTGFAFSRLMWGRLAALLALVVFLFEPNLLAHGRYATTDLGGVLFTFAATLQLWRMWQMPGRWSWPGVFLLALLMGLAFGSKISALGFMPIWLLLAVLPLYPVVVTDGASPGVLLWLRDSAWRGLQVITAALLSLLVVWAVYAFEWSAYGVDGPLAFLGDSAGPMPTYLSGVEQILGLTEGAGRPAFLLGDFSDSGFLSYFPVAFAVKTPLVLLAAIALAAVVLLWHKATRRRAAFLIVAALSFYGLTMISALNIGYRHVLPALPYLLVLATGLAAPQLGDGLRVAHQSRWTARVWRWTILLATLGLVATTLWIHPHYLSYFNRIAGGPENGFRVLIDSNLDWGQDLKRLRGWMAANDVLMVNLAWFGSADPGYYGIAYTPLPGVGRDEFFRRWWDVPFDRAQPEPGVYAISATNLQEMPLREEEKTVFAWFRAHPPDDRVGYSILIYDLR